MGSRSFLKLFSTINGISCRFYSATAGRHFKLAVIGGGAGGSAVSNMFSSTFGKENVAVIEPQEEHYYQPMWTLVGGGSKKFEQSMTPMSQILKSTTWIKDGVQEFLPGDNAFIIGSGEKIKYDYLVIGMGIQPRYDQIKGLENALKNYPDVCTNYDPKFVKKTMKALENFEQGGVALFTMNTPIKCPGAPQKIMYLADDYFRKHKKRDKTRIIYATQSASMLGPKKYGKVLYEICQRKNLECNFFHKLIEIDPNSKTATFEILDKDAKPTGDKKNLKYDFIHVGPPFSAPEVLRNCKELTDAGGWLNLDKFTLQHPKFSNIFGLGDCTNLPNSKTAAAVAAQAGVLKRNLKMVMQNKKPTATYDGYASCPIPTSYSTGILAEFDYNLEPLETFPIDGGKERRLFYYLKADIMPLLYWHAFVKGWWEGPSLARKILHFGRS